MIVRAPSRTYLKKTMLASLVSAALAPHGAIALDLAQKPPGTADPYVAPNVILSLDDSTSMDAKDMVNKTKTRVQVLQEALEAVFSDKTLIPDGKLRLAWQSLGNCTTVSGLTFTNLGTAAASTAAANTMRILEGDHRVNLLKYAQNYKTCTSTPTHKMVKRADEYMRADLHQNGPWASKPSETLAEAGKKPLGCRRNYHILLTDGGWNGDYYGPGVSYFEHDSPYNEKTNSNNPKEDINTDPINYDNQDSKPFNAYGLNAKTPAKAGTGQLPDPLGIDPKEDPKEYPGFILPDGTPYSRDNPNTWIYRDIDYLTYSSWHEGYRPCRSYQTINTGTTNKPKWVNRCTDIQSDGSRRGGLISTLADWTFKSWATPLQPASSLDGTVSPLPEYAKAPNTETFTNPKTKKTATLEKYWNPRYNPATWPHLVTFTIGFSKDSLPSTQYRPMGNSSQTAGNIGKYWNEGTTGANNDWGSTKGLFYYLDGPTKANNTDATTNNGNSGNLIKPSSNLPYGYDGSFADYAAGRAQWYSIKQPAEDMWHAAINGRGQFYAVEQGEDLKKAFEQIVRTINDQTSSDRGSTATSGSNASQTDVGIYLAKYDPDKAWKGEIAAELFKIDGSIVDAWGGKTTADKLDAADPNARVILTWSDAKTSATAPEKGGVAFRWATNETYLSTSQKALLTAGGPTGAEGTSGQNRVNYLRGVQDKECSATSCDPATPFRRRASRQGDIVNSEVWYVGAPISNYALEGYTTFARTWAKRTPMIYVGGNDGMLHGFKAGEVKTPKPDDGSETLAYIPRGVIHNLSKLTAPSYDENHLYFVDGSPMTGDIFDSTWHLDNGWRTLLVGTLGAGGRGYFVLDVTNPGKTDTGGSNFSEANANSLVVMDKTLPASTTKINNDAIDDLGHIFAKPVMDDTNPQRTTQIVRMNNNRWAAVMGNGYNSANGRPVLLIQYLDGDKELLRLPAKASDTDNGLSAPRLVDINGDGRPDVVYAGDLKGNMWKFLINTADSNNWGVATWEDTPAGTPLFTAKNARSITAAPSVRVNDRSEKYTDAEGKEKTRPVGGMMVAFGTGRNVTLDDRNRPTEHKPYTDTLYSVLDNTRYKMTAGRIDVCLTTSGVCGKLVKNPTDLPHAVTQDNLVESTIPNSATHARDGKQFWKVNHTNMNWATKKGWFMDFPVGGERLLKPMQFYDGSNLLTVASQVPASGTNNPDVESCEGGPAESEKQYVTFINIMDGQAPRVSIIDGPDGLARFNVPRGALTLLTRLDRIHVQGRESAAGGGGTTLKEEKMRRMPEMSLRPNWRQLK